ncbi:iron chelate uptake ABC transporter family permease subunit, partial [Acinetobacter baumannii]
LTLILAGVAVNAIAWSVLGYLTFVSDDTQLRNLTFWTMGSLGGASWSMVPPLLVLVGGGIVVACRLGGLLNLYQLGEAEAGHLGVDAGRLRL